MRTVHCIDISGSMTYDMLRKAKQEMLSRYESGDVVIVFDHDLKIINDPNDELALEDHFKAGGMNAEPVLAYAKSIGADTILYSDGYIDTDDFIQFTHFVNVV